MSAVAAMPGKVRFDAWCGWCVAAVLALTPLAAWLGPLAYAPLMALLGLAVLPAARVTEEDRPVTITLLVIVVWACGSIIWSPYRPPDLEAATGLKLVLQAPIYWAALCGARRASPRSAAWALRILAWGMAALGAVMLVEALTGAGLYQALRTLSGDPIRPDLAAKNVAKGGVVLAVLWGPAAVAAWRVARAPWLVAPMLAGLAAGGLAFGADAPLAALGAGAAAGLAVWLWSRAAPWALAGLAALFFLFTPMVMRLVRDAGGFDAAAAAAPQSWAQRIGYWSHAVDWIGDHPARGWGLDASRMFSPGIHLHPHDAALQVWLELGLIGATAAAVLWIALFARLVRPRRDAAAAAGAASATAYLVFAAVSFGVWQEWWLALGALAATTCTLLSRPLAQPGPSTSMP